MGTYWCNLDCLKYLMVLVQFFRPNLAFAILVQFFRPDLGFAVLVQDSRPNLGIVVLPPPFLQSVENFKFNNVIIRCHAAARLELKSCFCARGSHRTQGPREQFACWQCARASRVLIIGLPASFPFCKKFLGNVYRHTDLNSL